MKMATYQREYSRKDKLAVSWVAFALGLFFIVVSILYLHPIPAKHMKHINGQFENYHEKTGRVRTGYIMLTDGITYTIDSIVLLAFQKEAFLAEVSDGDEIELIVDDKDEASVLAISKGGKCYMSLEGSQARRKTNQTIGIFLGSAFFLTGCGCLWYLRSGRARFAKRAARRSKTFRRKLRKGKQKTHLN